MIACALGLAGCQATTTLSTIGLRHESGLVRRPTDVLWRDDRLVVTGIVETSGDGSVTACGAVGDHPVLARDPMRPFWMEMAADDFLASGGAGGWSGRSLVMHEAPLPDDVRREARVVPTREASAGADDPGLRQTFHGGTLLEIVSIRGRPRSQLAPTHVPIRTYRLPWSWPVLALGEVPAFAFDLVTFPVQFYLCRRSGELQRGW